MGLGHSLVRSVRTTCSLFLPFNIGNFPVELIFLRNLRLDCTEVRILGKEGIVVDPEGEEFKNTFCCQGSNIQADGVQRSKARGDASDQRFHASGCHARPEVSQPPPHYGFALRGGGLGRVEEETKRLALIREELEGLADPMRKEVAMVRKKIDSVNKELKPLGHTVQKKEREYKEALEAFNEKNREKVQLITRLMELVGESEKMRMKKLEELSKNIDSIH